MAGELAKCQPTDNILIRGRVNYSHILKKIEGEELEKTNQAIKARGGKILETQPYYSLVLNDAQFINPTEHTKEVQDYINSKLKTYQTADGSMTTRYYAKSKSTFTPIVVYSNLSGMADGKNIPLKAELATGLDVTVSVSIYRTSFGNNGSSFNFIMLNEPLRYWAPGGGTAAITAALAAQGIVYQGSTPDPDLDVEDTSISGALDTPTGYTPQMNPQMNPQVTPQVTPQMNPQMNPQVNPQVTPQMNPQVNPQQMPPQPSMGLNNQPNVPGGVNYNPMRY